MCVLCADIRQSQEPSFSIDAKGQPTGSSDSCNTAQFFASMVMLFTQTSSFANFKARRYLAHTWETKGTLTLGSFYWADSILDMENRRIFKQFPAASSGTNSCCWTDTIKQYKDSLKTDLRTHSICL